MNIQQVVRILQWLNEYPFPHLTRNGRLTESSHVFNMKECVTLRTKMAADP
jgi:hypothetical protein